MPITNVYNMAGEKVGEIELSAAIFGVEPNKSVLHDSVLTASKPSSPSTRSW